MLTEDDKQWIINVILLSIKIILCGLGGDYERKDSALKELSEAWHE
jgi:hypothetical protein